MAQLHLKIISPDGKVFDQSIVSVSLPGVEGGFGILKNHAPMVSMLDAGVVKIGLEGEERYYAVSPGIFEIDHRNNCVLLTSDVKSAESAEAAKEQLASITV